MLLCLTSGSIYVYIHQFLAQNENSETDCILRTELLTVIPIMQIHGWTSDRLAVRQWESAYRTSVKSAGKNRKNALPVASDTRASAGHDDGFIDRAIGAQRFSAFQP